MNTAAFDPLSASDRAAGPALETIGLTRRFGEFTAVDAISFAVPTGAIFGLLGPNGAGKSTTIRMLTTLLAPTAGSGRVAGFDIIRQAVDVRRVIGYVPQMLSADGNLTAFENLLIFAKVYGIPGPRRKERIMEVLAFMGLAEVAGALVNTFSGGMIRRLEIAQSMLHRPVVLFLDEPTVGLDQVARRNVWEHILKLRNEFGTTILLTTHYMEEAEELCEQVAIMHRGRIVTLGAPEAIKAAARAATLDDAFAYYTGSSMADGGTFRDAARARRVARRLG